MNIVIIGAGPAGLLLAHRLLARSTHYTVHIYDQRSDPRHPSSDQRAYVLSLTERGKQELKAIDGLWQMVKQQGISVGKTGIYDKKQEQWKVFPRDTDPEKFSLLINRNNLCSALLDDLTGRGYPGLHFNFEASCVDVDLNGRRVKLAVSGGELIERSYDLLVGADGLHSVVKSSLLKQPGFDFQQSYFDRAWKVLHLPTPQVFSADTSYFFRDSLPSPHQGEPPSQLLGAAIPELHDHHCLLMFWEQSHHRCQNNPPGINTPTDFQQMVFKQWLPGVLVSDALAQAFIEQRVSSILETRCNRYHDLAGQCVLVGDAAHAMSSALAQGCQAAFSDVVVLDQLLHSTKDQLQLALPEYSALQVKEGHAITELNKLLRPKAKWVSLLFGSAMMLQSKLNKRFPQWVSPTPSTLLSKTTVPYRKIYDRFRPWMSLIGWSNQRVLAKQKLAYSSIHRRVSD